MGHFFVFHMIKGESQGWHFGCYDNMLKLMYQ